MSLQNRPPPSDFLNDFDDFERSVVSKSASSNNGIK